MPSPTETMQPSQQQLELYRSRNSTEAESASNLTLSHQQTATGGCDEALDSLGLNGHSSLTESDSSKGQSNPCFITVETEDGVLEKYPVEMDDDQFTVHTPTVLEKRQSLKTPKADESEDEKDSNGVLNTNELPIARVKKNRRLVAKGGRCNVELTNVPKKRRLFVKDVFTTMVDMPWRYVFLTFGSSFMVTWTVFAVIWYIISFAHGDFEEDNLPGGLNQESGNFTPCVWAIHNFASCYLFSVETQHTIGYGSRQTTEECPEAIIIMSLQSIIGVLCSSAVAGIVFAKLARPKNRSHTVIFSKNAVITQRDGKLYLVLRISNIRKSHLIESHVRAQLVHNKKVTREGDVTYFYQEELKLTTMFGEDDDSSEDRTLMLLPATIFHCIDKDSPFYNMTPKQLFDAKFEMVVVLEGIVEPTGNSVQARTSYLPHEIMWGYTFENMITYNNKPGTYVVDCSYLNAVNQDETPRKSAAELDKEQATKEVMLRKEEIKQQEQRRLSGIFRKASNNSLLRGRFMRIPVQEEDDTLSQEGETKSTITSDGGPA